VVIVEVQTFTDLSLYISYCFDNVRNYFKQESMVLLNKTTSSELVHEQHLKCAYVFLTIHSVGVVCFALALKSTHYTISYTFFLSTKPKVSPAACYAMINLI